ncbi:cupin [uncultured Hyphomonas sp.]|jgi:mannose-6-phosphate isomerase-like protein (cupin superfamily)|uniref:cupin n=1 Tax=uncultured Hyphomonas sp. TaxID=225298 RepID=UPI000C49D471|nr:cupin [Hyphomonadaceae bacterium]MBL4878298.1 cupin [Hyphomonas sp.]|tara:strand:+ start:144210 stop:144521 length:312 start_codon:yes stop_codon:yes gene_type:complete
MKVIRGKAFTAPKAWGAVDVANMGGITTRLHWTDQPYIWHVNEGEEVFAVLDGVVDMHYRKNGTEKIVTLETGDIFFAGIGCEHVAHPRGEARILVVEHEGSV